MQIRVKFAALGHRRSRLSVISRSPSTSCGQLHARLHSLTFASLRVMYNSMKCKNTSTFVSTRVRHIFFSDFFYRFQPYLAIFNLHMGVKNDQIWGWFTPINFFYQMEKILFYISHYKETFPFGF